MARTRMIRTATLLMATFMMVVTGLFVATPPSASAAPACRVDYTVNQWPGGFTANVTIRNTGTTAFNGWTVTWTWPNSNQRVTNPWNATVTQNGSQVSATNMSYNANIPAGGNTSFGFNGSWSGSNPSPTNFAVNGITCGDVTPTPTPTATPTSTPTPTPIVTPTPTPTPTVTPTPNPVRSVVASPTSLNVTAGSTGTVGIRLSQQPTSNVTVTITRVTGSTAITASPTSLTFTPNNWNTAQNVTFSVPANTPASTTTIFAASANGHTAAGITVTVSTSSSGGTEEERFLELYNEIKDPANGYFSPQGVPYHSIETLIVEAPDYGHETTSEAYSYWLWLEAMYGRITGNWQPLNDAWSNMEQYIIPSTQDQPTNSFYDPSKPASYAAEWDLPNDYPSPIQTSVSVGVDPIAAELRSAYGTSDMYAMHWLLDVDNWYGYGRCGDGTTKPSYINTFQRGPQESVWETVPHPSCETFDFGGTNGFLPLFIQDSNYARQWRYTNAPDADARAVQVIYWALKWAADQGKTADVSGLATKAAKMGDYLRYSLFDKYFKKIGCTSTSCATGTGKDSAHYLLSWYFAWGGATDSNAGWAFRIGSSHAHGGYQNPLAAYALSTVDALKPRGTTAVTDWQNSLTRQIEFYTWLQSAEGAIAGGATNSWQGRYLTPPAGTPTFYGMMYDEKPVYHDPPSNQWFGFQAWSMERVAEYYHETGDVKAKAVLDKWVAWALSETTLTSNNYEFPSTLAWSGAPNTWNPSNPTPNTNLHVSVVDYTNDVGVAGSYVKTLLFYGKKANHTQAVETAKGILDRLWQYRDDKGISQEEVRRDYNRFDDPVYVPSGFTGQMANGDPINSSSTFISIRSKYRQDPDWPKVQAYLNGGPAPTFNYHRFWAQIDIATALATYDQLFG